MNKQELIAYLDVVCDAESAVQACEDAIYMLQTQKNRLMPPGEPYAPVHETATKTAIPKSDAWKGLAWILWFPLWILYFFVFEALGWTLAIGGASPHALVFGIITSILVSKAISRRMDERASANRFEKEKNRVMAANHEADEIYQRKMEVYRQAKTCYDTALNALDNQIRSQESMRSDICSRRDQLYGSNVIYPTFRNLIAVYQIREYLQMGICEELEGINGAYSMYMNDVRTARITDSIHDLKESLTSAIRSLQGALVQELRTVDGNLTALQNNLSSGMQGISQQMQQMQQLQQANSAQLNAHLAEANRHLTSMSQNTAIIAHNEYVEQRMRNVDAYLLKWPVR